MNARAAAIVGLCGAGALAQQPVSFELEVLPLVQRHGCSAAECHGGATGRGGLKLSLFGSDPDADHRALALDLDGRRIDPARPARSLLLQKGRGRIGHGGGVRFGDDDRIAEALRRWVAEGAPRRSGEEPTLVGLDLDRDGDRLRARARLADPAGGEWITVDVSDRAQWSSVRPDLVSVDREGQLFRRGPGPATLLARFGHLTAAVDWAEPFGSPVDEIDVRDHSLDRAWIGALAALGLSPGPEVDRPVLLRRLFLDLVGRPPRLDEFEAWRRPDADLDAVVDGLLASTEFRDLWAGRLAGGLGIGDGPDLAPPERQRRAGLRQEVRRWLDLDRPLSELASWTLLEQPAFLSGMRDPRDRAEWVSRRLLGVRLECARCHDHPLDRWRQRDHLAFSAWLAAPRRDGEGRLRLGRVFDPANQRAVAAAPLPLPRTAAMTLDPNRRMEQLAAFVGSADHGLLARRWSGFAFAALMGRGLTEPVDDHRPGNPPALPAVRDALEAEFARDARLTSLLRWLVASRFYRTMTTTSDGGFAWTHRRRREMPAEVWPRAVAGVLGVPLDSAEALPAEPTARVLAQWHGDAVDGALRRGGTTVDAILEFGGDDTARLRELFVKILSRPPTREEVVAFGAVFDDGGGDVEGVRDLAQALLLCREFREMR